MHQAPKPAGLPPYCYFGSNKPSFGTLYVEAADPGSSSNRCRTVIVLSFIQTPQWVVFLIVCGAQLWFCRPTARQMGRLDAAGAHVGIWWRYHLYSDCGYDSTAPCGGCVVSRRTGTCRFRAIIWIVWYQALNPEYKTWTWMTKQGSGNQCWAGGKEEKSDSYYPCRWCFVVLTHWKISVSIHGCRKYWTEFWVEIKIDAFEFGTNHSSGGNFPAGWTAEDEDAERWCNEMTFCEFSHCPEQIWRSSLMPFSSADTRVSCALYELIDFFTFIIDTPFFHLSLKSSLGQFQIFKVILSFKLKLKTIPWFLIYFLDQTKTEEFILNKVIMWEQLVDLSNAL